jgi:predicted permease
MLFGYIIIPVIIIPFLVKSIENNDKDTESGLIAILIGSVVCALIFSCLNLVKRKR